MQALEDDDEVARFLEDVRVVDREPAADVDERILLRAHPGAVGVRAELMEDFGDALARVALLPLLDEPGVLDHPCRVEKEPDPVPVAKLGQGLDVRHRDRLATRHVDGAGERDVSDLLGALLRDQRLELAEVDVALERMQALRVVGLVTDHVHEDAAGALLVEPRRREVHVPRDILARLDRD